MGSSGQVQALSKLQGVRKAVLCSTDGTVLDSSGDGADLSTTALSLRTALDALQTTVLGLQYPITLAVDTAEGALYFSQSADAMLVVTTTREAIVGEVRLEMREVLQQARR